MEQLIAFLSGTEDATDAAVTAPSKERMPAYPRIAHLDKSHTSLPLPREGRHRNILEKVSACS